MNDFHTSDDAYQTLLVSVWEVGEAVGPLLTASLSEIYGRCPIYNFVNVVFVVFSVACALSNNASMLAAFRFFNGIGDGSLALNASVVGDMFRQEERGLPVALMAFPPLIGPVAGPIIGGYLTDAAGWQWAFWLSAITGGVCTGAFGLVYRETYRPRLRQVHEKKAQRQQHHQHISQSRVKSNASFLLKDLLRPIHMLFTSKIVLLLSAYVSIVYGLNYILLTTMVEVFENVYGFSQGAAGLSYLGLNRYVKHQSRKTGKMEPEHRLPVMLVGAILVPLGFFLYGWTAEKGVFYVVPMIGTGIVGFGFFATTIPLQAYLVDAFGDYAASAVAATVVSRCVVAAVLPLAGPPLYDRLGLGWGNSVLGFIAVAFVPVPVLFMRYGRRLRAETKIDHSALR
ncbi:MAG: hypothetical protein Q9162_006047 [Coniocarpon cinnabarinum]